MASTQPHGEVDPNHDPHGHGHSTAAWVAVSVVIVGSFIMALAVAVPTLWLFILGALVVIAGGVAGKVLHALGFGPDSAGVR